MSTRQRLGLPQSNTSTRWLESSLTIVSITVFERSPSTPAAIATGG
jgi:hypothetical protein